METNRDYEQEFQQRVVFIRDLLKQAGVSGIVFGNSGGKDSALVGILCKAACENTVGVMLPCQSKRNFEEDMADGIALAEQFRIETMTIDLSDAKTDLYKALNQQLTVSHQASANIAPRLRMTALYTIAQSRGALVAGTGNRSETYLGYFTKWGDGAYDFNPISDLTVKETYEFLEYLKAPEAILRKAPSAGLYEGQTDEAETGISYRDLDTYLLTGAADQQVREKIEEMHRKSEHKRQPSAVFHRW